MDLKNVLNETEKKDVVKEEFQDDVALSEGTQMSERPGQVPAGGEAIRVHKKPIQLRDIENRSASNRKTGLSHESDENIKSMLNDEKVEYYKQAWNKLDNGMKINRIKLFSGTEKDKNNLTQEEYDTLKKILIHACKSGKLNKSSDISYNKEEGIIECIKILKYNEETKEYKVHINENKKKQTSSKSKSNIDRFLKTKK